MTAPQKLNKKDLKETNEAKQKFQGFQSLKIKTK